MALNCAERKERGGLCRKWAAGKATSKQIKRCMELDRKAEQPKRLTAFEQRIMERTRANVRFLDSMNAPDDMKLSCFMAIFHPNFPADKTREMIADVKATRN